MKEGWTNKTLGEVCKIYNGNSINADYKKKHFLGATGGLPFIATKDVSSLGLIDYNNGVRIPNYEEYKVAPANSVFICAEGGSAGKKFAYVEKEVCFGNKLFCIAPKDKSLTGKFVYHFVQSDNFRGQFFSLLTGLIGGVSAKKFQTIEIPVPPLSEQQSIVDYLDSAFAKIDAMKANAEKALNEAKTLFQATLKEMLEPKEGWEEKTMDDVCVLSQGLAINSKTKHLLVEKSSIPLLRIKDMKDGTREVFVDDVNYPPKCLAHPDELIYTRTGTLGLIFTGMFGIVHNNCFKIKLDEKTLNKYYYMYFVGSDNFRNMILSIASRAAQPDITHKLFKVQKIQFPPISEQQSIVKKLDSLKLKVDRLQENYDKISQECDALKQAILRQVFE